MALTVTQAQDVNTLIDWVLRIDRPGFPAPTSDEAREAAERLAADARKRLMAGVTAAEIAAHWPPDGA